MNEKDIGTELERILKGNKKLNKLQRAEIQIRAEEIIRELKEGNEILAESDMEGLGVILEFLYVTKDLTLEEYNDLCNFADKLSDRAGETSGEEG